MEVQVHMPTLRVAFEGTLFSADSQRWISKSSAVLANGSASLTRSSDCCSPNGCRGCCVPVHEEKAVPLNRIRLGRESSRVALSRERFPVGRVNICVQLRNTHAAILPWASRSFRNRSQVDVPPAGTDDLCTPFWRQLYPNLWFA